MPVRAG